MALHYNYNWTLIPPVSMHDLEFWVVLIILILQTSGGLFHCLFFISSMDS